MDFNKTVAYTYAQIGQIEYLAYTSKRTTTYSLDLQMSCFVQVPSRASAQQAKRPRVPTYESGTPIVTVVCAMLNTYDNLLLVHPSSTVPRVSKMHAQL